MKSIELEECIISPFKINLNIYIIYKTIKIKILTSNHKKGQQKYPQNGQQKKKFISGITKTK